MYQRFCFVSPVALTVAFMASTAQAQTAPVQAAETRDDENIIIVTATKREEALQNIPMSITAIGAQSLVEQNLSSISEYYTRIPGLTYAGKQQYSLAIRGVTNGVAGSPTVGVTIDDVPVGSTVFVGVSPVPDLDPAILQQIEVLRGPQGTLYGASSLGGLIRYVTAEPDSGRFFGRLQATGETTRKGGEGGSLRGALNIPVVTDRMAVSLSGFYRRDPAYADNVLAGFADKDANASRTYGGRAAMRFTPTENFSISVSGLLQRVRSRGLNAVYLKQDYTPQTGDLEYSALPNTDFTDYELLSGRMEYDLGPATLTSVTGYSHVRDGNEKDVTPFFSALIPVLNAFAGLGAAPSDRVAINQSRWTKKFTQEVRLASNGEEGVKWIVGAYFTKERIFNGQVIDALSAGGPRNIFTVRYDPEYREYAGFADVSVPLSSAFDIGFGGRIAHNRQLLPNVSSGPLNLLSGLPLNASARQRSSESVFTWQVTPRYRFSDDLMVYARAASGYRPGGANLGGTGIPETYDADRTTSYEVGLKGAVADGAVSFDIAAFYIDWRKIQLLATNPATGGTYFVNGDDAESKGVEGSILTRPWRGATLSANATYNEATLADSLPGGSVGLVGPAGTRLPFIAKFTGNIFAEQIFESGKGFDPFVAANLSYVGERKGLLPVSATSGRLSLADYAQLDLRVGVRAEGWSVELFARNLTDTRGYVAGDLLARTTTAGGFTVTPIRPRTFGVLLSADF